jgi:tetratricopeptide (TPR) repeat protein
LLICNREASTNLSRTARRIEVTASQSSFDLADLHKWLGTQQQARPLDLSLAHDLGLINFWQVTGSYPLPLGDEAQSGWRRVIANWAMVLGDDGYWGIWTQERSRRFGKPLNPDEIQKARGLISERIVHLLAEFDHLQSPLADNVTLEMVFHLETRAIQLLRKFKGFVVEEGATARLFCGPLMVEHLDLGAQVGQLAQTLQEPDGEASDLLQLLRRLMDSDGDALDVVDGRHRRNLMRCFSQLGPAFVALEREEPQKTLDLLRALDCPDCEGYSPSLSTAATVATFPRTCAGQCSSFAAKNPAYSLFPDRGTLLFNQAVELTAEAHMALAEQDIRAHPPKVTEATNHWQDSLDAAQAIGIERQFRDTLVTTALGRATTLGQSQHLDEGIVLLEAVLPLTDDERVLGRLAELFTDRGVKRGNADEWEGAVEDLRNALNINPHSVRARSNLVTALRGAATSAKEAGLIESARQRLEEARAVLKSGLEIDRGKEEWQTELLKTEFELMVLGSISDDGNGGDVATLLDGLMAVLGSGTDATGSPQAEAMRLMAEAAEKAAEEEYREALRITERALVLDPDSPLLLRGMESMTNNYGVQLADQGDFEQAIEVLEGGVRRFPDNADLQRNLQSVRNAQEMRQLATDGSPLAALETLLRVLSDESDGSSSLSLSSPPGRDRASDLADRGRAKADRGDLTGAITDLEEALSLAPSNQSIRRSLADTLEKHADALIAQGRREEGLAAARRGLMFVPDHGGLQATIAIAALGQAESGGQESALRTLMEGLARAAGVTGEDIRPFKEGPVDPGAAEKVGALLRETGLKYQEPGRHRYAIPFRTEHRDRLVAQLQVVRDLAVVSVPLAFHTRDEATLYYSLLRATFTGDYFKACRSQGGQLFLAAEVPSSVLAAKSLEGVIRDAISFADVTDADLASADKLGAHIAAVQAARRMAEGLTNGGGGLFGFLKRNKGQDESAQQLMSLCRAAGVNCQRVGDNRYGLKLGLTELNALALCKGSAISFIVTFGDMRPARGNLRFYQRVTEINTELDVWKVALDSDDDVAFMYELPALDENSFTALTNQIDMTIMRYGMELTLLS